MATISSLTELTTTASADKVAVDDASAAQTKYVSIKNLTGHGYGHIYIAAGSAISMGNISSGYSTVPFSGTGGANGEGGGATPDYATSTLTLPSTGGLFRIDYAVTLSSAGAATLTVRAYDGTAKVDGSENSFVCAATGDGGTIAGTAIYSSSGSEAIILQATSSAASTVTIDSGSLVITPIPASA